MRGERIVHVRPGGAVDEIPPDEEVIFGRTLYVPPLGTANRRIAGELGRYKLELGDGYMLHGTPHQESIGRAATHGCIRLRDADVEYLYRNVPRGGAGLHLLKRSAAPPPGAAAGAPIARKRPCRAGFPLLPARFLPLRRPPSPV